MAASLRVCSLLVLHSCDLCSWFTHSSRSETWSGISQNSKHSITIIIYSKRGM
jgi:hypothetical protein